MDSLGTKLQDMKLTFLLPSFFFVMHFFSLPLSLITQKKRKSATDGQLNQHGKRKVKQQSLQWNQSDFILVHCPFIEINERKKLIHDPKEENSFLSVLFIKENPSLFCILVVSWLLIPNGHEESMKGERETWIELGELNWMKGINKINKWSWFSLSLSLFFCSHYFSFSFHLSSPFFSVTLHAY